MKIAILSDIHGNIEALKSVFHDIDKLKIDRIYFLGDLVGYYYYPSQCLEELRKRNCFCISGNHEEMLIKARTDSNYLASLRGKYGSGHAYALDQLDEGDLEWLMNLPSGLEETLDGINLQFLHRGPNSEFEYLYPDSDFEILKSSITGFDYTFLGHSHYPFFFMNDGKALVNVGSVGQLREKGGLASWAIFETRSRTISIKYSKYEVKDLLKNVLKIDKETPYLREVLVR